MREYQYKHIARTLIYSKVTMVILFLFIILLLRSIMELNDKRMEAVTEKIETQNKRDAMETKVIEAKKKNEFIATERGFEEYVRTTYPVVKEGEGVIVVYDDDKTPVSDVREKMTVWERLTVIFQGIFSRKRDTLQEVQ